ncbi:DNA-binding protein WhiA [Irregularibacter muris]|uniref:Probable cell division protein WhiA n=1 Tax=Irregularibacter muris TaxID=1796619 RepID=A0AAE3HEQ0_9FIRM|nr:DNA-binding protein WhiA [Irregularibacter muris]MCR1899155.1 DNA-binding protein WhiA [Irregularibacter muris]
MSFSARTKNELSRIEIEKSCCCLAELSALIRMSGSISFNGNHNISFTITTENAAIARRVFTLLKISFDVQTEVRVRRNRQLKKNNIYSIVVSAPIGAGEILEKLGIIQTNQEGIKSIYYGIPSFLIQNDCCIKAYIRGAFLGGGSISDPEKTYHFEFVTYSFKHGEDLCKLINGFGLTAKIVERKNIYVVYIKEGDQIVTLLNIMQAHKALLDLENIRIYKEMRNNVNRIVNCETANLSKTVNAALRHIENIKYIRDNIGFHKLPQNLRDVAELRLNYQDASLKELGEKLDPPVGKSGINHRLRKLDRLAEDLKIKRGEAPNE